MASAIDTPADTDAPADTVPAPTNPPRPPTTASGRAGVTTIADTVVTKIASQAASEVDHAGGRRRRVLGVPAPGGRQRPKAEVSVDGRLARIGLMLTVEYPSPIRAVTRSVRARVIDQLADLAGIDAREVDITVVALPRPTPDRRRLR